MTSPLPLPAASPEPARAPLPIDIIDPWSSPAVHAGRSVVRRAVLAMRPVEPRRMLLPGPLDRVGQPGGVFWALRAVNDLHVALRTATFGTERAAREDAARLLARSVALEEVTVGDDSGTRFSSWYVLDGRVVFVAGHTRRRPSAANGRAVREALARLRAPA